MESSTRVYADTNGPKHLAPRAVRLASGRQLYVLNREGLLELREEPGEEVKNAQADEAIKRSMAREREASE